MSYKEKLDQIDQEAKEAKQRLIRDYGARAVRYFDVIQEKLDPNGKYLLDIKPKTDFEAYLDKILVKYNTSSKAPKNTENRAYIKYLQDEIHKRKGNYLNYDKWLKQKSEQGKKQDPKNDAEHENKN